MTVVAVDVGGTFTDAVAYEPGKGLITSKVPSTPRSPQEGVADAVRRLGVTSVDELLHATTIATNALLGQTGLELPRVALVTTRGFRDVIEIGRQSRPRLYDLSARRPRPLVPREMRLEVDERTAPDGSVIRRPSEAELEAVAERVLELGAKAVAVCFINSYANPSNELLAAKALRGRLRYVSVSSEVAPEPREYERTSTTVINAALMPLISEYLASLPRAVGAGRTLIMSSSGGLVSPEEASARPVQLIESGPAAGAIAAAEYSRALGLDSVVGLDMGGTTAKASTVVGGEVSVTDEYEVGGEAHHGRVVKGSGYPVRFPFVDLAEVSSGGGTIILRDKAGALRVGPTSAGADPGPASYGRGGSEPTITDAALALGWLPSGLAGGEVKLRPELAERALSRLGDPVQVAEEAVELAALEMARAVRLVTVERGLDPSSMAFMAFGGAGPMFAAMLAEEFGSSTVVVPPEPGLFSALGLLMSDLRLEAREPYPRDLEGSFRRLEEGLARRLGRVDYFLRYVSARYEGQGWELMVRAPQDLSPESVRRAFEEAHRRAYGFVLDRPVEVVMARVIAVAVRARPDLGEAPEGGEARPKGLRRAMIRGSWDEVPVYERGSLPRGARLRGPAIVEEYSSTTVVPRGWELEVGPMRALVLRR